MLLFTSDDLLLRRKKGGVLSRAGESESLCMVLPRTASSLRGQIGSGGGRNSRKGDENKRIRLILAARSIETANEHSKGSSMEANKECSRHHLG